MTTLVNEKILSAVLDNKGFDNEIKALLNQLIDEELAKEFDDMDCDLIEECTEMLLEIEQSSDKGLAVIIPLVSSEKIMAQCSGFNFRRLSRGMQAAIVACVILLSSMTVNAAVYKISGINIAEQVASVVSQQLMDWGIIPSEDKEPEIELTTSVKNSVTDDVSVSEPSTTEPSDEQKPPEKTTLDYIVETPAKEEPTTQPATQPEVPRPRNMYNMFFDANGGFCDTQSIQVRLNKPIGNLPVATREGYEFMGWYNINVCCSSLYNYVAVAIKPATVYPLSSDTTVTARWSKLYTITLDANGGTCDYSSVQTIVGRDIELPVPTREGYVFDGWYCNKEPVTKLDTAGDITAVAQWSPDIRVFKMTFNANGGQCDTQSKTIRLYEPFGTLPVPVRNGYIFVGWYTGNDINSTHITSDAVHTTREDVVARALWSKEKYTLTFDANAGKCDTTSKSIYKGQPYGEMPVPEMAGYTFVSWYYDGAPINSTTPLKENGNHTVVAKWKCANVPVVFDANGGTFVTGAQTFEKSFTYLSPHTSFPTAYYGGYEFVGWFTEREGGRQIYLSDTVTNTERVTYYAHWRAVENPCIITLYSNSTSNTAAIVTISSGERLGDRTPVSNNTWCDFVGWYTDELYGERVDENYIVTSDMELYAHWKLKGSVSTLVLDKYSYELNEKIDMSKAVVTMEYSGNTFVYDNFGTEGVDYYLTYDTGTYGEQRVHFITSMANALFGTVSIEAEATINVVGCVHKSSHIENTVEPTCAAEGYTGDTVCDICNETIAHGTSVAKLPHDSNTSKKLVNSITATCTSKGYTGDWACDVCGEILATGAVIDMTEHDYERISSVKATLEHNGKAVGKCRICGFENDAVTIPRIEEIIVGASYKYTGTSVIPEVTVLDINSKEITEYSLSFKDDTSKVGKHTVDVVFSGCYEGVVTRTFTVEAPTPKSPMLSLGSNTITISWDNFGAGADGYILVCYMNNKVTNTNDIFVKDLKSNSFTMPISDLKRDTTYRFTVRTYKQVTSALENKEYYSDWSSELHFESNELLR